MLTIIKSISDMFVRLTALMTRNLIEDIVK